ncbi:MAG: TolC family protein [Methylocella sp.]|nr:MAG: transporter [Hyphomicrobiales bacterium]
MRPRVGLLIPLVLGALVTSCATYAPEPLSDKPDLSSDVRHLVVNADQFPLPEVGTHRFDPRRPLDTDEVAMIAVANNPDLRATRSKIGVAQAQVFAAGILPNPQFSFEYGSLLGGPGIISPLLAGLSQDVVPLLTLSTRKAAARASEVSVELDVAWQEWQIVSRARLLFIDAISLAKQRRLIKENFQLFTDRYQRSSQSMQAGNEVLPTVTSDLVALNSAETQLNDTDQLILKNKHDLNALLGLTPEATLRLAGGVRLPALDAGRLEPLLMDLAARRPDLLALQTGYQAQDEKVRRAVIEQFPKLNVGSNFSRDNTDVRAQSVAVTISLPIFDRNQGNIAIERATREQLWEEYQARLDAAYGGAKRLISELRLAEDQYRSSGESVRRLRDAVATAEPAFRAGNLDERTFVDLRTSLLAKEITTAKLEQSILQQRVGLQTLIGSRLLNRRLDLTRMP